MSDETSEERYERYSSTLLEHFKSAKSIAAEALASIIERDGKQVRAYLRKQHTRNAEVKHSRWEVNKSAALDAAKHFSAAKRLK
jgi:hypothetical protein